MFLSALKQFFLLMCGYHVCVLFAVWTRRFVCATESTNHTNKSVGLLFGIELKLVNNRKKNFIERINFRTIFGNEFARHTFDYCLYTFRIDLLITDRFMASMHNAQPVFYAQKQINETLNALFLYFEWMSHTAIKHPDFIFPLIWQQNDTRISTYLA